MVTINEILGSSPRSVYTYHAPAFWLKLLISTRDIVREIDTRAKLPATLPDLEIRQGDLIFPLISEQDLPSSQALKDTLVASLASLAKKMAGELDGYKFYSQPTPRAYLEQVSTRATQYYKIL